MLKGLDICEVGICDNMTKGLDICEVDIYDNIKFDSERSILLDYIMNTIQLQLNKRKDDEDITTFKNNINIYCDDEQQIIQTAPHIMCGIMAIKDKKYNNKFMITYTIKDGYTTKNMFGFFVFFNEKGAVCDKKMITSMIVHYDLRDVCPTSNNIFLYGDNLIFIYTYRDIRTFCIQLLEFSPITTNGTVSIDIKSYKYDSRYGRSIIDTNNYKYIVTEAEICWQRNDIADEKFKKYIVYDFTSLTITNNNKVTFKRYFVDDYKCMSDMACTSEELSWYEEYPIKCIKCNLKTATASANYDLSKYGNTSVYFGNSFCYDCMIRYSASSSRWQCCKIKQHSTADTDICICNNNVLVEQNYVCTNTHVEIQTKFNSVSTHIPPYLKKGTIVYGEYKRSSSDDGW